MDVSFLAATNRNLEEDVGKGRFREDLLYRLNLITVHVPPLAERPGDIPVLARRFLAGVADEAGVDQLDGVVGVELLPVDREEAPQQIRGHAQLDTTLDGAPAAPLSVVDQP